MTPARSPLPTKYLVGALTLSQREGAPLNWRPSADAVAGGGDHGWCSEYTAGGLYHWSLAVSSEGYGSDYSLPILRAGGEERCQACQGIFQPGERLGRSVNVPFLCRSL